MSLAYSSLKATRHLDIVRNLREGVPARPAHVHLILSDLCNQSCLPAGTMIACPGGHRPIEELKVGDQVVGSDGVDVAISEIGSRWADVLYEIRVDRCVLLITGEHPVRTRDGWKEASRLVSGDPVVVRVRVAVLDFGFAGRRELSDLEPRPVSSIRVVPGRVRVYNFSCPPIEAYEANGVIVHNCSFCAYRNPGYPSSQNFWVAEDGAKGLRRDADHPERNYNPNRMIPFAKVLEILEDCKAMGVSGVQLTGGGEPTVHPQFKEICAALRGYGISYAIVSNGSLGAKRDLEEDFAKAAWVRISIDAGSEAEYSRIRNAPASHWHAAWDTVMAAAAARDLSGSGPLVGVGYVVTPDNWQGVYDATRMAKLSGADNIRISALFSEKDESIFADTWQEIGALCAKAVRDFHGDGFEVINRFGDRLDDLRQHRPDYSTCGYQQFTTYIGADLNVYRCCVQAYNDHGLVGSLEHQRFRELWMSQARMDDMVDFDARSCDRCMFNGINRTIDYVVSPEEPLHHEFV